MKQELVELKESTARHESINKSLKDKLLRDKEEIAGQKDGLEEEVR